MSLTEVLLDSGLILLGLVLLLAGGEWLVRGAVSLAAHLGVPSLLIGLTIVAFGTSAPELFVSIKAVMSDTNGIAIGNIIGSNIANIFLVLGLPAILAPISLKLPGLRRHTVVMIAATLLFAYIIYIHQVLDLTMGLILTAGIILYIAYAAYSAMRPGSADRDMIESEVQEDLGENTPPLSKTVFIILLGLIGLPIGASLLVGSGANLASGFGVRDELIGLTIVAFGTSLPELATVWAAARKGDADVACGNIVGSNIFNILFVGGAMGLFGTTQFTDEARLYDVPVMIAAAVILALMIFARGRITRLTGILFTLAYLAYIILIGAGASPEIAF